MRTEVVRQEIQHYQKKFKGVGIAKRVVLVEWS